VNINATLIGEAIWFGVFIWITMKYVWPPLAKAMADRQKLIAEGLAAGERGKHELELAGKRSADAMRDAKAKAAEIITAAEKRGAQMVEEAKATAKIEADKVVAAAKAEIAQQVEQARAELRGRVADLAVAGAERILKREVDAKAHAEMLLAHVLGVPRGRMFLSDPVDRTVALRFEALLIALTPVISLGRWLIHSRLGIQPMPATDVA